MRFFVTPMYGVTIAKANIFLPALLQMSETWLSKASFL